MSRRPYMREASRAGWWLAHPRYVRYMLREISCIFIGAYALIVIMGLWRLSQGPTAFKTFLTNAHGTAGLVFSVLAMLFALYHTYTWFQVTPKAMPLVVAGKRVPAAAIVLGHWAGFVIAGTTVWLLAVE